MMMEWLDRETPRTDLATVLLYTFVMWKGLRAAYDCVLLLPLLNVNCYLTHASRRRRVSCS